MGKSPLAQSAGLNNVVVVGTIFADPIERDLADGQVSWSCTVITRVAPGAAGLSVPLVWFDAPGRAKKWRRGDQVVVAGAVARRFFRSSGRTISVAEVRIERAELLRHRARVARFVAALPDPAAQLASLLDGPTHT